MIGCNIWFFICGFLEQNKVKGYVNGKVGEVKVWDVEKVINYNIEISDGVDLR